MAVNMLEQIMPGRLHHISDDAYYAAKGRHILSSRDEGKSWHRLASVPVGITTRLKAASRLASRLFRAEIHHILPVGDALVVFAFGRIWVFDLNKCAWEADPEAIHGGRPLAVCSTGDALYYGEYKSNECRGPIRIYRSIDRGRTWDVAHQRNDIRHVHGVFLDPFTKTIWFTTGDEDHECGIWRTQDDFASVTRVLGGSQQFRAVDLVFTEDHVYFGTDTPLEQNYIYRFTRTGDTVEQIAPVASSVFYGARVGKRIFFGTVCEPSQVNETRVATIVGSDETGAQWREIQRSSKDAWPMKYFQYGQFRFPRGTNHSSYLWFSSLAVKRDQMLFRLPI